MQLIGDVLALAVDKGEVLAVALEVPGVTSRERAVAATLHTTHMSVCDLGTNGRTKTHGEPGRRSKGGMGADQKSDEGEDVEDVLYSCCER